MRAGARARTLERCRNSPRPADGEIGARVALPHRLVEIGREKPAGIVGQQRIDANRVAPAKVAVHRLVGDRQESLIGRSEYTNPNSKHLIEGRVRLTFGSSTDSTPKGDVRLGRVSDASSLPLAGSQTAFYCLIANATVASGRRPCSAETMRARAGMARHGAWLDYALCPGDRGRYPLARFVVHARQRQLARATIGCLKAHAAGHLRRGPRPQVATTLLACGFRADVVVPRVPRFEFPPNVASGSRRQTLTWIGGRSRGDSASPLSAIEH